MRVICLGLSHVTAPIAVRERAVFPLAALQAWWVTPAEPDRLPPRAVLAEIAALQTCNRTEVYAVAEHADDGADQVCAFLLAATGLDEALLAPHLYVYHDGEAACHLMEVAAGLDSLITGEAQILGQVGASLDAARREGLAGPRLTALFEAAVRSGRRARAETAIGQGAGSISSAAVALARRAGGDVADRCIAVVGAGKMGLLAADALRRGGATSIIVINRSYARASALAEQLGGRAARIETLPQILAEADIAICATGAPSPVIQAAMVAAAMASRPARPLVIVDIAVPRDVAADVGEIDGVTLFNVDDLRQMVDLNLTERAAAAAEVRQIVADELTRLAATWRELNVQPVLSELGRWADGLRRAELERALRRLKHLSPEDQGTVAALSEALVAKLLHSPLAKLRAPANGHDPEHYAAALCTLFDLAVIPADARPTPHIDIGAPSGVPEGTAAQ